MKPIEKFGLVAFIAGYNMAFHCNGAMRHICFFMALVGFTLFWFLGDE